MSFPYKMLILFLFLILELDIQSVTRNIFRSPYAIRGSKVQLRKGPGLAFSVTETLKNGTMVNILKSQSEKSFIDLTYQYGPKDENPYDWIKIRLNNGSEGWVLGKNLCLHFAEFVRSGWIGIFSHDIEGESIAEIVASLQNGSVANLENSQMEDLPSSESYNQFIHILDNTGHLQPVEQDFQLEKKLLGISEGLTVRWKSRKSSEKQMLPFLITPMPFPKNRPVTIQYSKVKTSIQSIISQEIENIFLSQARLGSNEVFGCDISGSCTFQQITIKGEIFVLSSFKTNSRKKTMKRPKTIFMISKIRNGLPVTLFRTEYLVSGDGTESEKFLGITDLDGNGIYELWTETLGYEWWYYNIYSLEKDRAVKVFKGGGGVV